MNEEVIWNSQSAIIVGIYPIRKYIIRVGAKVIYNINERELSEGRILSAEEIINKYSESDVDKFDKKFVIDVMNKYGSQFRK